MYCLIVIKKCGGNAVLAMSGKLLLITEITDVTVHNAIRLDEKSQVRINYISFKKGHFTHKCPFCFALTSWTVGDARPYKA